MPRSRLILASSCLAALFSFAGCAAPGSGGGTGGSSSTGGSTGTGGSSSSTGGSTATGGSSSTGGSTGTGGLQTTGTGGTHTGGTTGTGGSSSTGGSTGTGGSSSTGGSTGTGGSSSTGGSTGNGGSSSTGGNPGTGGTIVDQGGMALAKPGATTATSKAYLNLGDMRLINNRWGSDQLIAMGNSCSSNQSVFVNSDKTIGWSFNRGNCNEVSHGNPDFPEVEFGVAPFGKTSSLLTSPAYSSTTLLPIQLSKLTSASVTMDNFSTTFSKPTYWDANFEFWISKNDPTTNNDGGVYAEIITFTGWNDTRQTGSTSSWACQFTNKTVPSTSFSLCHQSDTWASGWRFFNFLGGSASSGNYSGKVDIKAILDYVRSQYSGFTDTMYLTRIEVGTEIDDNTAGSSKTNNLTFEINGTSKSIQLGN